MAPLSHAHHLRCIARSRLPTHTGWDVSAPAHGYEGELLKKLMACLLALVLSCSCALPVCAKARKANLNPEARAAQKRNKARQKQVKKQAKARQKEMKRLKAVR